MSSRSAINDWSEAESLALASGSCASVLSAATLSWRSSVDEKSAAGGLNGPSQWLWGERAARTKRANFKHTVLGFLIHHASSLFWATVYEKLFGAERHQLTRPNLIAAAAATAVTAYVVDYYLIPRRLRPGFEKHMTSRSRSLVYLSFAVGLAGVALARPRKTIS